jgi:hypothetical protein
VITLIVALIEFAAPIVTVIGVWRFIGKNYDKAQAEKEQAEAEYEAAKNSPNIPTWCQFCDETKPFKDFDIDIIGRLACYDCRKLAGLVDEEKQEEPVQETLNRRAMECDICGGPTTSVFAHFCVRCENQRVNEERFQKLHEKATGPVGSIYDQVTDWVTVPR